MNDLTIDFSELNLAKAERGFDRMIAKVQQLQQQMLAGSGFRGGSSGGSRGPKVPGLPDWIAKNPVYQRQALLKQLADAQRAGNPAGIAYMNQKLAQNQKRINAMTAPQNKSGSLGVLSQIRELSAAGGPVGMALSAAGAIVTTGIALAAAFVDLTKRTADLSIEFNSLRLTTGGTAGQAGALSGIGGALGLKDAEIASIARSLNENLKSGVGIAAGGTAGVGPNFDQFNLRNDAKLLLNAIEGLHKAAMAGHQDQAQWAALQLNLEQFLPVILGTDKAFQQFKRDGALTTSVMQQLGTAGQDFMTSMERLGKTFSDLTVTVVGPMLPALTDLANGLVDFFQRLTVGFISMRPLFAGIGDLIEAWAKFMILDFKGGMGALDRLGKDAFDPDAWKKAQEDAINTWKNMQDTALKANTDALNKNTEASNRQGTFGGGSRAAGAIPSGWGAGNQRQWVREAYALGNF